MILKKLSEKAGIFVLLFLVRQLFYDIMLQIKGKPSWKTEVNDKLEMDLGVVHLTPFNYLRYSELDIPFVVKNYFLDIDNLGNC